MFSRQALRFTSLLVIAACSGACDGEPSSTPEERASPVASPEPEPDGALHLKVSPHEIARARQEAAGLARMPRALRAQTLERRRAMPAPSYAELSAGADEHARARASFEGRVAFVRRAGPRLWILPLHTRRGVGDRWADPIYVLSTVPPGLPVDGALARFDGWVVGDRTIGANTLPLIVAYSVESLDAPE